MVRLQVEGAYDAVADVYDSTYVDKVSKAEDVAIYDRLRKKINGRDVLDVGCGTGGLLDNIEVPSERYTGVDISQGMLRIARVKHPNHVFIHDDFTDFKEGGSYGHIFSLYGSVSHMEPCKLAKSLDDCLADDGDFTLVYITHFRRSKVLEDKGIDTAYYFEKYAEIKRRFNAMGLSCRCRGFSILTPKFEILPQKALNNIAKCEIGTLGRVIKGKYFIVEGGRKCHNDD